MKIILEKIKFPAKLGCNKLWRECVLTDRHISERQLFEAREALFAVTIPKGCFLAFCKVLQTALQSSITGIQVQRKLIYLLGWV